jgi:hypothetical protein
MLVSKSASSYPLVLARPGCVSYLQKPQGSHFLINQNQTNSMQSSAPQGQENVVRLDFGWCRISYATVSWLFAKKSNSSGAALRPSCAVHVKSQQSISAVAIIREHGIARLGSHRKSAERIITVPVKYGMFQVVKTNWRAIDKAKGANGVDIPTKYGSRASLSIRPAKREGYCSCYDDLYIHESRSKVQLNDKSSNASVGIESGVAG